MPAVSVVDTSILVAHLRGSSHLTHAAERLFTDAARPAVVTVTHYELYRAAAPREAAVLQDLLGSMALLSVTAEVAREAGLIWSELLADGFTIDIPDQFIAAGARLLGVPVLTLNPRHFRLVRRLTVLDGRLFE